MIFAFTIGEIVNTIGNSPYVSRRIPASHRGRVNGYVSIAYGIGGMGGRVVAGLAIDQFGFNALFSTLDLLGVICVVIIGCNYRTGRKLFPKLYDLE